jgi:hypothetical protein
MTGFKARQGSSSKRPVSGTTPASLWKQGRRAVRRYLLISTGISSTALGLALIVSFIAATYGGSMTERGALTSEVEVDQIEGRFRSALLDSPLIVVAPELAPSTAMFPAASPAPPLDVERRAAEETEPTPSQPEPAQTPPPSPPAADIDVVETPQPLDEAAAALPEPVLAQEIAAEASEEDDILPLALPGSLLHGVNVTFYDCLVQGFCGDMYNGEPVYEGAAACSWDLPLGTRFAIQNDPTGRIYICADRGLLLDTWVDIFFYSPEDGWAWQQSVGRYATILILSLPTFDSLS